MEVTRDRGYQAKRKRLEKRGLGLLTERQSWDRTHGSIADYLAPGSARFMETDANRGERRDRNIYDDTGGESLRTLVAGLMSRGTSPARPWFALRTEDADLGKFRKVKEWLADCEEILRNLMVRTNTYRMLPRIYKQCAAFGTAAAMLVDDDDKLFRLQPMPWGHYCLAHNHKGEVDTLYRQYQMTVGQVVQEFGLEACSDRTKALYDRHEYDTWLTIWHAVEPRMHRNRESDTAENMPWQSCYFEQGVDDDKVLRESGFLEFPALTPRWEVEGDDVYGYGPGRQAIGAIRQLQQEQYAKAVAIDKGIDPPLELPGALKGQDADTNPGGRIYNDALSPHAKVRSIYEQPVPIDPIREDIEDVRRRIRRHFFADLFRLLDNVSDTTSRTAYEVRIRMEESMAELAPALTNLTEELHRPLVERVFEKALTAGLLPPPPDDILGANVGVEFVSVLAQAQKAVGAAAMDRYILALGSVAALSNGKEQILDVLDEDYVASSYADMLGVDPRVNRAPEKVADLRKARNEALAAKEQQEAMAQMAPAAKDMAGAAAQADALGSLQGYYGG
ncbi:MAG: portal protein [Leptolyngbyaceae bacterium]|nr:portal protein [Leptolyngbyaceae bacterium]